MFHTDSEDGVLSPPPLQFSSPTQTYCILDITLYQWQYLLVLICKLILLAMVHVHDNAQYLPVPN